MSLSEYRRKRQFQSTPEPTGDSEFQSSDGPLRFVIQKHAARQLHYDLRLEYHGVLKSWAIPKGPSLDPADKRLAIHVEDHPLEYLSFEGIIPAGEYGAGAMIVWDQGTWQQSDEAAGYEAGQLKFTLNGHKLQGKWMLLRTGKGAERDKQWLLFKERDNAARTTGEVNVLTDFPNSVATGRSLEQVQAGHQLAQTIGELEPSFASQSTERSVINDPDWPIALSQIPGVRACEMPLRVDPCLPASVKQAPAGDEWIHEIKLDGYRMVAYKNGGSVRFISRNGRDWTDKFSHLASGLLRLPLDHGIFDGEVVYLNSAGVTDFQQLQATIGQRSARLRYIVFDLMYADGYDLTKAGLTRRKEVLAALCRQLPEESAVSYSEHLAADGPIVFQEICQLGGEGIISKRRDGRYVSGRSETWMKVKCVQSDEFLIGGYTRSTVDPRQIGALHLGYFDQGGQLRYAGRVGTGFTAAVLADVYERLEPLQQSECPFVDDPIDRSAARKTVWVEPQLVAEVEFGSFTSNGRIRFARFKGLRDDLSEAAVHVHEDVAEDVHSLPMVELPESLREMTLTHPDRILFPETGTTKLGLVTYYAQVAKWMLPHVVGRPLSLLRGPRGSSEKCFFQKRPPAGLPDVVRTVSLGTSSDAPTAMVVDDLAGILALVQFGVLEFHAWQARADRIDRPDRIVFDLDPDVELPWSHVVAGANLLHDCLRDLELTCFVNVTGGKGLHVVVPIRRRATWEMAKEFSERIATSLQTQSPGRFTSSVSKQARRGKIYIDFLRNARELRLLLPFQLAQSRLHRWRYRLVGTSCKTFREAISLRSIPSCAASAIWRMTRGLNTKRPNNH